MVIEGKIILQSPKYLHKNNSVQFKSKFYRADSTADNSNNNNNDDDDDDNNNKNLPAVSKL
jgi:hypothetical protein